MRHRQTTLALYLICAALASPRAAGAQAYSLVGKQFFLQETATALRGVESGTTLASLEQAQEETMNASLFRGRAGSSLFRAVQRGSIHAKGLMQLIASAEAGKAQYDAVQYGARTRPEKRPTDMTLAEIYAWIDATPGQPHAIGRYQFIPATLRRLAADLGVSPGQRFSPRLQDRLAHRLLEEAGLGAFMSGSMPRTEFMNNLAKIWAGLPNSSGKSHYHNYAGNRAVLSWASFEAEMRRIFPS